MAIMLGEVNDDMVHGIVAWTHKSDCKSWPAICARVQANTILDYFHLGSVCLVQISNKARDMFICDQYIGSTFVDSG
jgi:hypothetical protein